MTGEVDKTTYRVKHKPDSKEDNRDELKTDHLLPGLDVFMRCNGIEAALPLPLPQIGNAPVSFSVSSTIAVFTCCTDSCGSKTPLTNSDNDLRSGVTTFRM